MATEVIGHDEARTALSLHHGSFALLGPEGVGRSRIVAEWLDDRPSEKLPTHATVWSYVPGVVYVVDADDHNVAWEALLRPLEEGRLTVAVIATDLPAPVLTRLPAFRVGLLSDFEVSRVLQLTNRMLQPRQLIAKLLGGSLARLDMAIPAAKTFETLDNTLATGTIDPVWNPADARAALWCFQAACVAVATGAESPFKKDGLERIPFPLAMAALDLAPHRMFEQEARNALIKFLRVFCR